MVLPAVWLHMRKSRGESTDVAWKLLTQLPAGLGLPDQPEFGEPLSGESALDIRPPPLLIWMVGEWDLCIPLPLPPSPPAPTGDRLR